MFHPVKQWAAVKIVRAEMIEPPQEWELVDADLKEIWNGTAPSSAGAPPTTLQSTSGLKGIPEEPK